MSIAQKKLPIIKSFNKVITIRDGGLDLKNYWTISPEAKPDIYDAIVSKNTLKKVSFITDVDSISFKVEPDKTYDFIVLLNKKDSAFTRIVTHNGPADFSKNYIKTHNNKTIVEAPEVYELVNIVLSLTDKGLSDSNIVIHDTRYYTEMIQLFKKFSDDKIVKVFDSLLKIDFNNYFYLKMDAYSFHYKNNNITRSKIYNRVSWGLNNTLLPYIHDLQRFSYKTNFQKFYNNHTKLYAKQISYYKDSLDLKEMQLWLNKNFPTTSYNCVKVIFSPLVGYSQSANWFDCNGFKEAQAHVNFPYHNVSDKSYSRVSTKLRDQRVVFTELNHAFINLEVIKYVNTFDFKLAFSDLKKWELDNSGASKGYPNAYSCFNEYMNWGLVSLRYVDLAPSTELESLLKSLEKNQKEGIGFTKFPEFNRNLIKLYTERKKGETIADLYPAIIKWCKEQAQ